MEIPETKITPVRQQYLDIKQKHSNAIVFFRLGDFYETFDEDAEITSRELDIVLTSRKVSKSLRVPMAGIPYHAAENYIGKLIRKGYHVAICEQVGKQPQKGLVTRKVVRTITPGTIVEQKYLNSDNNNFLASIITGHNSSAIAYIDISTGDLFVTSFSGLAQGEEIKNEIDRVKPSEILMQEKDTRFQDTGYNITKLQDWKYEYGRCKDLLLDHFRVKTLKAYDIHDEPSEIQVLGSILQYIKETQAASLKLIRNIKKYSQAEYMVLDSQTRRNLEISRTIRHDYEKGSLLGVLDRTLTPMGKRKIRNWINKPLLEIGEIQHRQNGVQYFYDNGLLRQRLRKSLKRFPDLERVTSRIVSGIALPRDLVSLRDSISQIQIIRENLGSGPEKVSEYENIPDCAQVYSLLNKGLAEDPPATFMSTGIFKVGLSSELDEVYESSKNAREYIANLEATEKERTGIKTLKVGYNKVFGYYIEVSRRFSEDVPEEYIRKQTLVNAERFITPEMKEYEAIVLNAEEEIRSIERRVFKQFCASITAEKKNLFKAATKIGTLDVILALSEVASLNGYSRPKVTNSKGLKIIRGRHPVVEKTQMEAGFVPNDSIFEDGEIIRIITGPNMSGKSTFLRQVALLVLMAQIGSFIPAESAEIGIVDRIFTRIGAQDEIHGGQSTFMVEMVEAASILNNATERSLLILDEIGRGTSTYDGLAIAWSIIEYIHNHPDLKSKTLFATHYHELTQLEEQLPGVTNFNVAVSESDGQVIFLHKIIKGASNRSYGIHVAQIAGMPSSVITRADEIMHRLETTSETLHTKDEGMPEQMNLFLTTNPLLEELKGLDINNLSPIDAITRLYEWKRKYLTK